MGRWWCSPRAVVPGRSICLPWRRSSRWRRPSSLSFTLTRIVSGGSSASPLGSTPSRTGATSPKVYFQFDFIKGYLNAISASWGTACDLMCRGSTLHELPWQKSNMQNSQGCCDTDSHTQEILPDRISLKIRRKHSDRHRSGVSQTCWIELSSGDGDEPRCTI